jgi:hypothetical protein
LDPALWHQPASLIASDSEIVATPSSRLPNSAESADKPHRATLLAGLSAHHLIPKLPIMLFEKLVDYYLQAGGFGRRRSHSLTMSPAVQN